MSNIVAWHGRTVAEHCAQRDAAAKEGYRFLSLSIYGSVGDPRYAAVMIRRPSVVAQRDWPSLSAAQFQQVFDEQAKLGYGPVIIAATGAAGDPRFAAVFEPQKPIPLTRHLLTAGDFKTTDNAARKQGLILRWAAAYGDAGDPRYAAVWSPNADNDRWSVDGLADEPAAYQARFNAQTSAWCRPAFVTLNASNQYLSLFVDRQIGPWVAHHSMSADDYQKQFDTLSKAGYFPSVVQAAGPAQSARFAALFVKQETATPKKFSAVGANAVDSIDAIVRQTLQDSPVRHASLAIVHQGRLVYTRGYTAAEPDWPVVQPTTCFRMASVSKAVTALAVYQLIESGALTLDHKLQDILQLRTPAGGAPPDARFGQVTIRHLLEHTSGINGDAFRNGVAVGQAFQAAGHPVSLPVSETQTDAYIASLPLNFTPGDQSHQAYCNCGYYLLSRVVAKLRGTARAIDAYQKFLLAPLHIQRIRLARSLVAQQPSDEARYQQPQLALGSSEMSPQQPLVPSEYGTEQMEIMEGAGGLSGANTDVARLIAILTWPKNNAALKRATIQQMLSAGAALTAKGLGRAGYGFDAVADRGSGKFYAQKGGSLASSGNVLQFDGDWGFALSFGGYASAGDSWYPDYPAVMNIAKQHDWGTVDLFPQFGMPSLQ